MGRRANPHVARGVHLGRVPGLGRSQSHQPRGRHARPRAAALPADVRLSQTIGCSTRSTRWSPRDASQPTACPSRRATRRCRPSRAPALRPCRSSSMSSAASPWSRCCRPPPLRVSGSSPGCRWQAGCSPASTTRTPGSPRTTTAATTGMAKPSTWVRRSAGCRTTSVSVRPARSPRLTPPGALTTQLALRWVIDQPGVSTVIAGARNVEQARANAAAADLAPLGDKLLDQLREVYDGSVREHVHDRW